MHKTIISLTTLVLSGILVSGIMGESSPYPRRIISLVPSLTEELYLLGVEDRLIANTIYCERPPDAKKKEKVGTLMKADIEKIVGLKPDLVLASNLTSPEQVEKLENIGINVIEFIDANSFSQMCEQFMGLGRIVGKENKAEEIINEAKDKVNSIIEKADGLSKPRVFIQIGARPLFAANKDFFLHDFIRLAGGINIAEEAKTGLYSREKVLGQNPDIIIILTMGITGEKEREVWRKYRPLNAVKNNRIHILDPYKACSPTPVTFVETLGEMFEIFHPVRVTEGPP